MVGKVTIEFPDFSGDEKKWLQYNVKYFRSKRGNFYAKLIRDGMEEIYVWKRFEDGVPVLTLKDGKWIECGRIVGSTVFIGSKDQLSYEEWLETPEGQEYTRRLFESLRNPRRLLNE